MDESRGLYAKRNKCHHQRTNIIRLYLYEILRVVKFKETESIMVFARAWREGEIESCCLMDIDRASVLQDEKSSGNCLLNNVKILNNTELYTQKYLKTKIVSFMLYIFYRNEK